MIKTIFKTFLLTIVFLILFGCAGSANDNFPGDQITMQTDNPYLGQKTPGLEPEIFAPGIVSSTDFHEYSGTFSPDGSEYYFYRFSDEMQATLYFTELVDGEWTTPEILPLTTGYTTGEPHVTLDNQWLYFMWGHAGPDGATEIPPYFVSERTQDGWSEPKYAGMGMFLSSDLAGNLYTTDMSERSTSGRTYLARVTTEDGVFGEYERLDIQPRYGRQAHPCIAPDGSYILFDVESGNHLFVSFKNTDGTWGEAIDLAQNGFDRRAGGATISPDGKYLFFSLDGDIRWVDIAVIENLRPSEQ